MDSVAQLVRLKDTDFFGFSNTFYKKNTIGPLFYCPVVFILFRTTYIMHHEIYFVNRVSLPRFLRTFHLLQLAQLADDVLA